MKKSVRIRKALPGETPGYYNKTAKFLKKAQMGMEVSSPSMDPQRLNQIYENTYISLKQSTPPDVVYNELVTEYALDQDTSLSILRSAIGQLTQEGYFDDSVLQKQDEEAQQGQEEEQNTSAEDEEREASDAEQQELATSEDGYYNEEEAQMNDNSHLEMEEDEQEEAFRFGGYRQEGGNTEDDYSEYEDYSNEPSNSDQEEIVNQYNYPGQSTIERPFSIEDLMAITPGMQGQEAFPDISAYLGNYQPVSDTYQPEEYLPRAQGGGIIKSGLKALQTGPPILRQPMTNVSTLRKYLPIATTTGELISKIRPSYFTPKLQTTFTQNRDELFKVMQGESPKTGIFSQTGSYTGGADGSLSVDRLMMYQDDVFKLVDQIENGGRSSFKLADIDPIAKNDGLISGIYPLDSKVISGVDDNGYKFFEINRTFKPGENLPFGALPSKGKELTFKNRFYYNTDPETGAVEVFDPLGNPLSQGAQTKFNVTRPYGTTGSRFLTDALLRSSETPFPSYKTGYEGGRLTETLGVKPTTFQDLGGRGKFVRGLETFGFTGLNLPFRTPAENIQKVDYPVFGYTNKALGPNVIDPAKEGSYAADINNALNYKYRLGRNALIGLGALGTAGYMGYNSYYACQCEDPLAPNYQMKDKYGNCPCNTDVGSRRILNPTGVKTDEKVNINMPDSMKFLIDKGIYPSAENYYRYQDSNVVNPNMENTVPSDDYQKGGFLPKAQKGKIIKKVSQTLKQPGTKSIKNFSEIPIPRYNTNIWDVQLGPRRTTTQPFHVKGMDARKAFESDLLNDPDFLQFQDDAIGNYYGYLDELQREPSPGYPALSEPYVRSLYSRGVPISTRDYKIMQTPFEDPFDLLDDQFHNLYRNYKKGGITESQFVKKFTSRFQEGGAQDTTLGKGKRTDTLTNDVEARTNIFKSKLKNNSNVALTKEIYKNAQSNPQILNMLMQDGPKENLAENDSMEQGMQTAQYGGVPTEFLAAQVVQKNNLNGLPLLPEFSQDYIDSPLIAEQGGFVDMDSENPLTKFVYGGNEADYYESYGLPMAQDGIEITNKAGETRMVGDVMSFDEWVEGEKEDFAITHPGVDFETWKAGDESGDEYQKYADFHHKSLDEYQDFGDNSNQFNNTTINNLITNDDIIECGPGTVWNATYKRCIPVASIKYNPRIVRGQSGLFRNLLPWNPIIGYAGTWAQQKGLPFNLASGDPYFGNVTGSPIAKYVTKKGIFGRPKKWIDIYQTSGSGVLNPLELEEMLKNTKYNKNTQKKNKPSKTELIDQELLKDEWNKEHWNDILANKRNRRIARRNFAFENPEFRRLSDKIIFKQGRPGQGNYYEQVDIEKKDGGGNVNDYVSKTPTNPFEATGDQTGLIGNVIQGPNTVWGAQQSFNQPGPISSSVTSFNTDSSNFMATEPSQSGRGLETCTEEQKNDSTSECYCSPTDRKDPKNQRCYNINLVGVENTRKNIWNVDPEAGVNVFNAATRGVLGAIDRSKNKRREQNMILDTVDPMNIYATSREKDRGDQVDYGTLIGYRTPEQGQNRSSRATYGNYATSQYGGYMQMGGYQQPYFEQDEEVYMTPEELEQFLAAGGQVEYL